MEGCGSGTPPLVPLPQPDEAPEWPRSPRAAPIECITGQLTRPYGRASSPWRPRLTPSFRTVASGALARSEAILAGHRMVPPTGFEPALTAPEGVALYDLDQCKRAHRRPFWTRIGHEVDSRRSRPCRSPTVFHKPGSDPSREPEPPPGIPHRLRPG